MTDLQISCRYRAAHGSFGRPRPIDKKADYDAWCELLNEAGVRHVRLHDGRYISASS